MVVEESMKAFSLSGPYIDLFEDKTNRLTIKEVSSPQFANKFYKNLVEIPTNKNTRSTYWLRFVIKNNSTADKNWIFEFFDFRIDNLELHEPDKKGGYSVRKAGDQFSFLSKEYLHKNFAFNFKLPENEATYFVKIKSEESAGLFAVVRTHQFFTHYSLNEYFSLALFYGILISLSSFTLFLFITIRQRVYLYYAFYLLGIGMYALSLDGIGFQYLWPDNPEWNNKFFAVALYWMVCWILLYARTFLFTKTNQPLLDKIIIITLILRTLLFLLGITFVPSLLYVPWLDVIPLLIIYVAGILIWKNGYIPARYYVMGFTFLFGGFLINSLNDFGIINNSILTVYAYNFGVVLQMFCLAFALADRIREIDRNKMQMEERNKELDTFVYKASHDIKGPLKSIIGLTTLGAEEVKAAEAKVYFDMILKNTARLDTILANLIMITKVKETSLQKSKVDLKEMIEEILFSFEYFPSYKEIDFKININKSNGFYSDPGLLYSIFQNLIENAIKYKKISSDPLFEGQNERSYLHIDINIGEKKTKIVFKDNGLGIPKEYQKKIFDMFFRIDSDAGGSGLGLYLVKMSVEKLGGTIHLESERGVGTTFTIEFNN